MVQESVPFDCEVQSSANPMPPGVSHRATVLVSRGRSASNGESVELMLAEQRARYFRQRSLIRKAPRNSPLIAAPERRGGLCIRPHLICVASRNGAVAGVKLISNVVRLCDPDVGWEQRVERSAKLGGVPCLRHSHVRSLSSRVNPSVRPSRSNHRHVSFEQSFEHALDDALYCYRCRLTLPSGEP